MSKYLPNINLNGTNAYMATLNKKGSMTNLYSPFKNLQDALHKNLGDFTTNLLNFDLEHPVDILVLDSYDGSVNLILNDGKNQPRLIGSRFSIVDNNEFKIPDHSGMKDTNIYDESTFDIDTSLKAIAQKIPQITYKGMSLFGGSLPCGAYTFYFKLSDADGNESEVIAESGIVQVFIGGLKSGNKTLYDIPDPQSIRMGLEDENSSKSVSFKLTNVDSGFDYVHVLYARSSSGNEQASTDTYYKVQYDYPIFDGEANITITGKETILPISANELYTDYADIQSVKTQTIVNNVLFFGNTSKKERDWNELRKASWKILPSYATKANVGSIDYKYTCGSEGLIPEEEYTGCYYNTFNTYYRVGYWPDEIYLFGIVYIFNDNSLSPVFSIQGVDFNKFTEENKLKLSDLFCTQYDLNKQIDGYQEWETDPDDYYFDKELRLNSKGVIKFPKVNSFKNSGSGRIRPNPLYISFDLSYVGCSVLDSNGNPGKEENGQIIGYKSAEQFYKEQDIKGYFFVRKTRIPTILAQGLTIGLTEKDRGAVPTIKSNGVYNTQSFLGKDLILNPDGTRINIKSNVSINAALVPDSELSEATFNLLFVSNKYTLDPVCKYSFDDLYDKHDFHTSYVNKINSNINESKAKRKLTNVQDGIKTLTDGEVYFSTMSGDPADPIKTKDVNYIWNETAPLYLTESTSLIRGNWGPFVGIGDKEESTEADLKYGTIYNIKLENYFGASVESTIDLEFQKRFNDVSSYKAICHRTEISNLNIDCYRGDCFQSLFTHRMFRNFIDPELPTNDKIINPRCWAENYAVRNTADMDATDHGNLSSGDEGWKDTSGNKKLYANEIATAFEIKERPKGDDIKWDAVQQSWVDKDGNLISNVTATSSVITYINTDDNGSKIHKVSPASQETGITGIIKNVFKSDRWTLRGVTSINRADVNAVALGEWITFPICSSKNLALRDVDYSNATEQAAFNRKRSFYPLSPKDAKCPLRDSNVINQAASISLPHKSYYEIPNVPFIKQEYFTRVINSLRDSAASITNEFKVMLETAYRDYTKIYGPITKLMQLGSNMLVVFHHGIGILSISEAMSQAKDASQYLPIELNLILSTSYGSMWKDSIIETQGYIYGVDTVSKVIWRVSSEPKFELLSPLRVEKFLIDNINLSEFINTPYIGRINVKSHYNAFKQDVMFTYYNDILYLMPNSFVKLNDGYYSYDSGGISISNFKIDKQGYLLDEYGSRLKRSEQEELEPGTKIIASYNEETGLVERYTDKINKVLDKNTLKWANNKSWSLCFNERTNTFVTFYDWIPVESSNIDNIFFTFDREATNILVDLGIKASLNHLISPISNLDNRDWKYGRNMMDKSFNTSIPITYLKNTGSDKITFATFKTDCLWSENIQEPEKIKRTVIGIYLKGNQDFDLKYTIRINYISKIENSKISKAKSYWQGFLIVNKDVPWKFITIPLPYKFSNYNISLEITLNNLDYESEEYKYGAVSDLIVKTFNKKEYGNFLNILDTWDKIQIIDPESENMLDEFYPIRDLETNLKLWKHGFAGLYDNEDVIKPTYWYGKLHEFNFEFIARKDAMHKIFSNLLLVSNKSEPYKFEVEVVGEVYEWNYLKPVLKWISDLIDVPTDHKDYDSKLQYWFTYVLTHTYGYLIQNHFKFPRIYGMETSDMFKKLPYMKVTEAMTPSLDPNIIGEKVGIEKDHSDNTVTTALVYDSQLNEYRVHTELLGNNVKKYGRLKGNMQYLEDIWKVEIRPIAFRYAYIENDEFKLSKIYETRPRDKYCKVKIRYSGEDLTLIQSIVTIFDYSYT